MALNNTHNITHIYTRKIAKAKAKAKTKAKAKQTLSHTHLTGLRTRFGHRDQNRRALDGGVNTA